MNTTFEATNSKSRVLIVDDNSRFAHGAQLFLEHTGNYFACAVNDPLRALETARSFKPDLVIIDLIMSKADGLEVATQLEADWALHEVPIVFVTALITPEEARDGRRINGHRGEWATTTWACRFKRRKRSKASHHWRSLH